MPHVRTLSAALLLLLLPFPARAQATGGVPDTLPAPPPGQRNGWDTSRVMSLVRRAIQQRQTPLGRASGLRDYEADAHGWLYFYVDRDNTDQRVLVKIDQIALNVYWATPGLTKQVIVGRRGENRLPNEMIYHRDHLAIVQNDFGSRIRLGGGEEVSDVPHPIAAGATRIYEYRIADSLSIYLPGDSAPVRVYRVQVRPKDPKQQAIIGSVYVDRQSAAIARMTFTFTPSAYRDRRLDFIRISLDNALWDGKYWLPYQQEIEIRRKIPLLNFPIGSVILGRYKITDYHFNQSVSLPFFGGPRIVMMSDSVQKHFPFKEGLYADLERTGLGTGPDLATVRREAHKLMGQMVLSGLPHVRLDVPNASSALRYDRAEGVFAGAGLAFTLHSGAELRTDAGFAFGAHRTWLSADFHDGDAGPLPWTLHAFRQGLRDLGQQPGTSRAVNTLAMATLGRDYLDPYYASGVSLDASHVIGRRWTLDASIDAEHDEAARLTSTASMSGDPAQLRPVLPITGGTLLEAHIGVRGQEVPTALGRLDVDAGADIGRVRPAGYIRPTIRLQLRRELSGYRTAVGVVAAAGASFGETPRQRLFLLGGVGTLPGYAYRSFVGDRYARISLEASRDVWRSWLTLRAVAGAGWTRLHTPLAADDPWRIAGLGGSAGIRTYAGAGIGLFSGIARLDLARGLDHGQWQLILSARPDLWGIL